MVNMTFRALCTLLALSVPAASVAADPKGPDTAGVIEEIVAKVNGDIITRTELERARRQFESELRQRRVTGAQLTEMVAKKDADGLRDRVDQLLLVQKGKELNINVDPEVIKYIAKLQAESGLADTDKFQAYIREQLQIPFEDYKQEIRNGMLTQRVIGQEVGSRINVPRAELQKYYEDHKSEFVRKEEVVLREILISTEGKDAAGKAAAEKKAKDLVFRARKGEKFGELAKDNSDAVTAKEYGDLGAWPRGQLAKNIEDLVFGHDRGYVTDPISAANGFLILKVEEKHQAGQAPFEEVENDVREKLYAPRMEPAVREYLTKLRRDAFLEIKDGFLDSGAAAGKDTTWKDPAQLKPETLTKEEVAARTRRKKLLWAVPIPGTKTTAKGTSQSK